MIPVYIFDVDSMNDLELLSEVELLLLDAKNEVFLKDNDRIIIMRIADDQNYEGVLDETVFVLWRNVFPAVNAVLEDKLFVTGLPEYVQFMSGGPLVKANIRNRKIVITIEAKKKKKGISLLDICPPGKKNELKKLMEEGF